MIWFLAFNQHKFYTRYRKANASCIVIIDALFLNKVIRLHTAIRQIKAKDRTSLRHLNSSEFNFFLNQNTDFSSFFPFRPNQK